MKNKRFHGKIGEDFEISALAWPHYKKLQEILVSKVVYIKGEALEIGCGPGNVTRMILNSNPKLSVLAIDNEPIMIRQAIKNLKEYIDKKKVKIVEADALDFLKKSPENRFDLIFSALTIHNFKKDYRHKVLVQIYRKLKKRGIFINLDKYVVSSKSMHNANKKWQFKKIQEGFTRIGRKDLLDEWINHYLEDEHPQVVMSEDKSKKEMEKIGFREIKVKYRKHMEAILSVTK